MDVGSGVRPLFFIVFSIRPNTQCSPQPGIVYIEKDRFGDKNLFDHLSLGEVFTPSLGCDNNKSTWNHGNYLWKRHNKLVQYPALFLGKLDLVQCHVSSESKEFPLQFFLFWLICLKQSGLVTYGSYIYYSSPNNKWGCQVGCNYLDTWIVQLTSCCNVENELHQGLNWYQNISKLIIVFLQTY